MNLEQHPTLYILRTISESPLDDDLFGYGGSSKYARTISSDGVVDDLDLEDVDGDMDDEELFTGGRLRAARQAKIPDDRAKLLTVRLGQTNKDVSYDDAGGIYALVGKQVHLKLYGIKLHNGTEMKLTTAKKSYGDDCHAEGSHVQTDSFSITTVGEDGVLATAVIPGLDLFNEKYYYFCLRSNGEEDFIHQGSDDDRDLKIEVYNLLLPIWIMIIFIGVLLCLSGLFSGLNLGLMALDQTELKIVQNTGSEKERDYANKIAPIRAHGNFLLCSLLLGNVLVNNTLTILLDTLTSGLVAVIGATMGIVIFGEIIPQAICSRHGLAVGAYTIWLTKFFMLLTFPLSFPISLILDKILGQEMGTVYDKRKLIELLRVTDANNDLEKEEVDIVTGALVYKDKTVRDVMTKLEDVYMLPMEAILDFDTVSDIRDHGYSRVPAYDGDRKNIVHVLFAKDLMFVDPDDNMALATVCEFYSNDVNFVFHDTPLNVMFNEFKTGEKGHMAFVQDIIENNDGDPYYETIGLVTLEDIIEEIIQAEIVDETDVITDNKTKKKRHREKWKGKESSIAIMGDDVKKKVNVSPQLTLAVFQYLSTSIEPFKPVNINDQVLKKLLNLDIFREIKMKKDKSDEDLMIIHKGRPIDYFILIVEGRVEVNIGKEELVFESGPFSYFGIQTLTDVMQHVSPSSPTMMHNSSGARAATTPSSIGEAGLSLVSGVRGSLRKASTQNPIDLSSIMDVGDMPKTRHGSIAIGDTITLPPSRKGSSVMHSATGGRPHPQYPLFVPDYQVKAATDVLYLKIRRAIYGAAHKATKMSHNKQVPHDDHHIDHLLEKVIEDDHDPDVLVIGSPKDKQKAALAPKPTNLSNKPSPNLSSHRLDVSKNGSIAPIEALSDNLKEKDKQEEQFWSDDGLSSITRPTTVDASSTTLPLRDLASKAPQAGGGGGGTAETSTNGPASLPMGSAPLASAEGLNEPPQSSASPHSGTGLIDKKADDSAAGGGESEGGR